MQFVNLSDQRLGYHRLIEKNTSAYNIILYLFSSLWFEVCIENQVLRVRIAKVWRQREWIKEIL